MPRAVEEEREIRRERPPENQPPARPRRSRRLMLWLIPLGMVALAGVVAYWIYSSHYESTDDAQIDGHVHAIGARVGGTVAKLLVADNQYVEAGVALLQIDPRDYQVALDRSQGDLAAAEAERSAAGSEIPITSTSASSQLSVAEAELAEANDNVITAQNQVDAAQARINTAQARLREARANYDKAARDVERFKPLVEKQEIARQQYDAAVATAEASRAQVEAAQAQIEEARQGIETARGVLQQHRSRVARAQAEVRRVQIVPQQIAISRARASSSVAKVQQRKADVEQAQLNLGYTTVKAPISGIISQRSVEVGQVVQPGQPLLAVVPLEDIWVTANFKETQLRYMRPGQPVTIEADAYGGRKYTGHIDSIAAATGARFSLLPPENATGNYVKVVQRVPVKILFDKGQDPEHLLRPGMSVVPTVRVK